MNLLETLKEFKNIKANPDFTEQSRRAVLASAQNQPMNARTVLVRIFETAGSLVLAGILVFAIAGGFSGSRFFSPISFSGIDPVALHAEADAIGMQINLANLNYLEGTATAESTAATPTGHSPAVIGVRTMAIKSGVVTSTTSGAVSTSTASSSISIDEALQQLTQ